MRECVDCIHYCVCTHIWIPADECSSYEERRQHGERENMIQIERRPDAERMAYMQGYKAGIEKGHKEMLGQIAIKGEWVWRKDENNLRTYDVLCSKCGHKIFTCENYDSIEEAQKTIDEIIKNGKPIPNYCMMCGSDNRKRGDENDREEM